MLKFAEVALNMVYQDDFFNEDETEIDNDEVAESDETLEEEPAGDDDVDDEEV